MTANTQTLDRLAIRRKPEGEPVMHQNWENLLFLHWPMEPALVRPLIPAGLELDLFDGRAWLGITPFAMTGVHMNGLPPVPGLTSFLELNVRTYVHYRGQPGIYFLSLDASMMMPAFAARIFYFLPYFKAHMEFSEADGEFQFHSQRTGAAGEFSARWRAGAELPAAHPDSLDFFLVERYGFFVMAGR